MRQKCLPFLKKSVSYDADITEMGFYPFVGPLARETAFDSQG